MSDLSHVGMTQCYFCNKDSAILLDTRMRNTLPQRVGVMDMQPCHECAELMKKGVMIIVCTDESIREMEDEIAANRGKRYMPNPYRTGHMAVVKDEVISRLHGDPAWVANVLKKRWLFMPLSVAEQIGLIAGIGEEGGDAKVSG